MATVSSSLLQVVLLLAATVIAVPLFKRLGLGSVLGYLIAGIAIGPYGLQLFSNISTIFHISELGVVMFLFIIGLEMKPSYLWALRKQIFVVGGLQVLTGGTLLTFVGIGFGANWQVAFVCAAGFVLTSTAMVTSIIRERNELNTPSGQKIISILLFQDLMIVPLLFVISQLSPTKIKSTVPLWESIGIGIACIAILIVSGLWLLNPLFKKLARYQARDIMTAAALLVVLGSGMLLEFGGLSMAMGAFLAGVLLSESSFRHQLEADIEPFRGLLLDLFFVSIGMSLNLNLVQKYWYLLLTGVLALMFTNMLVVYSIARLTKSSHKEAFNRAFIMNQGGEFAFVLYTSALSFGIINDQENGLMTAAIVISMAFTPIFLRLKTWIFDKKAPKQTQETPTIDEQHEIILVGVGRFGQIIRQMLWTSGYQRTTIIDIDQDLINSLAHFGVKTYFGDATRPELLRIAGIEKARLLIVAINNPQHTNAIVAFAKSVNPNLKIVARSYDRIHTYHLYNLGVEKIVRETFDSAVLSGQHALELLGTELETAQEISQLYSKLNRQGMKATAALYDSSIKMFNNKALNAEAKAQEQKMFEAIQELIASKKLLKEENED
ncbi:monovalent cation:proton antiporter-2 (CPA2) family protein [Pelistega sp. MC2]|uniref:monovalent cation:proton antiporter-2 (CPA2) family protein n=1 Tax=Pelistega sp. MC2 TaxID=1720297 RepID=UPI0008D8F3D4|nr:monovalent cation:proton antiporter-2 (CPA2) family protein [Pelistega sp. MC2]